LTKNEGLPRLCNHCNKWKPLSKFKVWQGKGKISSSHTCIKCRRIKYSGIRTKLSKNLSLIKERAAIAPDIDVEFLLKLLDDQDWTCALSGIKMTAVWGEGRVGTNISIDRISNDRPYTKDNIRLVCLIANAMKGKMKDEELIEWCRRITRTTKPRS